MVKLKEVQEKLKSDLEYIYSVQYCDFAKDRCMCVVLFNPLSDYKSPWNKLLMSTINDYIMSCDAILDPLSYKEHISIVFTVKL